MPVRSFDALDADRRRQAAEYVPGYDWIPGRFGPPPGIPKDRKEQFDRMSDKEFFDAFRKLSQEEKESLMISERERQRTFAAHWPIETIVKAHDCAKEGFYYTGVADRVQCAFCGGAIRNWERGDVPKYQHKNFFNYCKMVQNKPCQNIPISNCGLPKDLMTSQLSSSVRDDQTTVGDLNINTVKPKDPAMGVCSKRMDTYRRYPSDNPIAADKLCEAGFLYEGIGDKVKCFWCGGGLEMWKREADPWAAHARWYPGCTFVQQTKGLAFIKTARQQMTPDNIATAETLLYNKGDVSFLEELSRSEDDQSVTTGVTDSITQPGRINVVELITNPNDLSEQECKDLVDALRCKKCRKNMSGAVVLPCGCYCLCQDCSKGNLPAKCPACASSVKGACRTFLA
ncbi:baculoviral IAP repeat-containing protein 7-B-like isoform X2 [Watersipora subatra]|uniref:baculoviral IAP repeat-containing protein 7-B-like isoform X2 n=1 Tax=Watersipora subatra TaxID=2589382 RepID=UPI00355C4F25